MIENGLTVVEDANGFPVLMANVPNAGVAVQDTNARSGNPLHDARSGKFGSGGGKKSRGPQRPANVDPLDFKRMLDAARAAAREFDNPQEGDIREFLAGNAKNPEQVDVAGFLKLVQEQRLNDLTDALDQQLRVSGSLKRGRRMVKISMPKGFLKRSLRGLTSDQAAEIIHRLAARGHDQASLDDYFGKRLKSDVHAAAKQQQAGITASDIWEGEIVAFFDDDYDDDEQPTQQIRPEAVMQFAATIAKEVVANLPQPVVNITMPKTGPMRTVPHRNDKGFIEYVTQEPVEES